LHDSVHVPCASRHKASKQKRTSETLGRFDILPGTALVDIDVVTAFLGRSRASVWRDVAAGRLAKPVHVGARSTRWRVADVRAACGGA
jgi:predicted DNA-binding transcriptional regulator AlpA